MSWIDRMLEERLSQAAASGELDAHPRLKGNPIADLGEQREPGWWARSFVERESSHDRRRDAERSAALARAGFWRAADVVELGELVAAANAAIERANVNLVVTDQLEPFDAVDVETRWRSLGSGR